MQATQITSEASRMAAVVPHMPKMLGCAAPSSCTGSVGSRYYSVGYYRDLSALIIVDGEPVFVCDEARSYTRENIEHAARCLAAFTQEERARIVREKYDGIDCWIDGVHWGADGSLLDVA